MARAAFGDQVVDHYLNYARTEQGLFDASVTDWERSGTSSGDKRRAMRLPPVRLLPGGWLGDGVPCKADHRHHLLRATRALGRLGAAGRARPARLRDVGGAAGGRAFVVPPSDDSGRRDARRARRDRVLGRRRHRPGPYGADRHPETDEPQTHRDAGELALLAAALERDLPTLAICRGFQLLNILRGGDLVQHLPDELGHERHREMLGVFSEHPVEIEAGSRLESILGSRHGCGQLEPSPGCRSGRCRARRTAYAEDGTLEGLEDPRKQFALGVLWHPEMEEDDKRLFVALVNAARQYALATLSL